MNLYGGYNDVQRNGFKMDYRTDGEADAIEQARENMRELQERGQDAIGSNALELVESL